MADSEVIRRRNLPHWDVPSATYFITTCLNGSLPARGLLDIQGYRAELEQRSRPSTQSQFEWKRNQWKLSIARTDDWLDREPAVRHLADERLARIIVNALYFFAGERYDLLAFVAMPSHVHWVFQPLDIWVRQLPDQGGRRTPRQRIIQSLNRYTGLECNRTLGARGSFWQHECYDHWVRDADELERILLYVDGNPVKAGMVHNAADWPFSSAHDRRELGKLLGEPLARPHP